MKQDVLAMTARTVTTPSVLDWHRGGLDRCVSVLSIQRDAQDLEVMHRIVFIFTGKKNQS